MRRLVAVAAVLLLTACGTSDPEPARSSATPAPAPTRSTTAETPKSEGPMSEPEAAVDALMRALDDGDCDKAKRLVVTPSELGCDIVEQSAGSFADEGIDLDEVVYRGGPIHDASSTVKITWGNEYPTESYDVQQIDGRWKVVFDSAA